MMITCTRRKTTNLSPRLQLAIRGVRPVDKKRREVGVLPKHAVLSKTSTASIWFPSQGASMLARGLGNTDIVSCGRQ